MPIQRAGELGMDPKLELQGGEVRMGIGRWGNLSALGGLFWGMGISI